jgi:hypothetical protein
LELNGKNQLLVCADNILGEHTNTIKKNTEALLKAGRYVDIEVNTEKTKYMIVSSPKYGEKSQFIDC